METKLREHIILLQKIKEVFTSNDFEDNRSNTIRGPFDYKKMWGIILRKSGLFTSYSPNDFLIICQKGKIDTDLHLAIIEKFNSKKKFVETCFVNPKCVFGICDESNILPKADKELQRKIVEFIKLKMRSKDYWISNHAVSSFRKLVKQKVLIFEDILFYFSTPGLPKKAYPCETELAREALSTLTKNEKIILLKKSKNFWMWYYIIESKNVAKEKVLEIAKKQNFKASHFYKESSGGGRPDHC